MKEEWKEIKGYEGFYQVSNRGRVKSLPREILRKNNSKSYMTTEKFIGESKTKYGYYLARLVINNDIKSVPIHRLVAQAFIPNPKNKPQVNHINGVKTDNRVENLEWNTLKENVTHFHSKNYTKKIRCIETGQIFVSQNEANRVLGLTKDGCGAVLRGGQKQCKGYTFEYINEGDVSWLVEGK